MRRRGFTLIELTMVLLILAVIAAGATLRVQAPLTTARAGEAVDRIRQFDRLTRAAAYRQDRPLSLIVDLSAGKLERTDEAGRSVDGGPLQLGGRCKIARVLVRGRQRSAGRVTVPCSRRGLTPSYALAVDIDGRRQWLLFAGLTGEMIQVADETQAQEILAAAGRPDAG